MWCRYWEGIHDFTPCIFCMLCNYIMVQCVCVACKFTKLWDWFFACSPKINRNFWLDRRLHNLDLGILLYYIMKYGQTSWHFASKQCFVMGHKFYDGIVCFVFCGSKSTTWLKVKLDSYQPIIDELLTNYWSNLWFYHHLSILSTLWLTCRQI